MRSIRVIGGALSGLPEKSCGPRSVLGCVALLLLVGFLWQCGREHLSLHLPARLTPKQFASLVADLSEEGDGFESENLVSNETDYLRVVGALKDCPRDQVYVGVGPDQNFSYIAAIEPRLAFIVDIRRQNLVPHLLFKALFELAPTPQAYLQKLLCREVVAEGKDYAQWLADLDHAPPRQDLYDANLAEIRAHISGYRLPMRPQDWGDLEKIYRAFFERGLEIRYELLNRDRAHQVYPTWREFLLSQDPQGNYASYVGNPQYYQCIRRMQQENRILPVVGDFAGHRALSGISTYVRDHGAVVSLFYISNVEYYLLPDQQLDDLYEEFLDNLRELPRLPQSLLIRTWNNREVKHPHGLGGHLFTTVEQPLGLFLQRVEENRYVTHQDILFNPSDGFKEGTPTTEP